MAGLTSIINPGIIITQMIIRKDIAIKGKGLDREEEKRREVRGDEAKGGVLDDFHIEKLSYEDDPEKKRDFL